MPAEPYKNRVSFEWSLLKGKKECEGSRRTRSDVSSWLTTVHQVDGSNLHCLVLDARDGLDGIDQHRQRLIACRDSVVCRSKARQFFETAMGRGGRGRRTGRARVVLDLLETEDVGKVQVVDDVIR